MLLLYNQSLPLFLSPQGDEADGDTDDIASGDEDGAPRQMRQVKTQYHAMLSFKHAASIVSLSSTASFCIYYLFFLTNPP